MPKPQMFSILSTTAPLVEVGCGDSSTDLPIGLTVPDGTVTVAPAELPGRSVRRWRVDAPKSLRTSVVVTDSPFGAFVGVRPPDIISVDTGLARLFAVDRWPALRALLKHHAPTVLALWHLLADDLPASNQGDVCDGTSNQARAQGGDLVTVTFIHPRCSHA